MAYSESESHVLKKVKDFWLQNWSRAHDAIVVKIDKPPEEYQAPLRMQVSYIPKVHMTFHCLSVILKNLTYQAWHFCARDRPRRTTDIQPRTYVMS